MFGTEYNWLISISRPEEGRPRARLARNGLLTLAVAVFCFLCVSLRAEPAMSDLSLGQVVNNHFDFIGNAGWAHFEKAKEAAPARTVTILRTPVE